MLHSADLIRKHYQQAPRAHLLLLEHCRKVTRMALWIARSHHLKVDLDFVAEAAMLHDIGMIYTDAPELYCYGDLPYLAHGIKGYEILQHEGLPRHARVCERHTGVGLTAREIREQKLPLPARDMLPETLEEKLICYADLFFSKSPGQLDQKKSIQEVRQTLLCYGPEKAVIFDCWHRAFEPEE